MPSNLDSGSIASAPASPNPCHPAIVGNTVGLVNIPPSAFHLVPTLIEESITLVEVLLIAFLLPPIFSLAGVMIEFIDGLSKAEEQTAIKVLDDMGITEIRMRDALLRASGASDVFTKSLEIGTTAWDENNALTKEAEQRYGTTASQIEIAKNKMADAGITIGEVLAPHLITLAEKVADVAEWFGSLNPETQESIIKMAALAATIGPVLSVAGSLTSGLGSLFGTVSKVTKGVGTFSKAIQGGSTVIGALGTALGPGGLVILGMAAFATAAVLIYKKLGQDNCCGKWCD